MTDPDPEGAYFEGDEARVYRHRVREFERMGFNEADAIQLADALADHHTVKKWIAEGCSHARALEIIL